MKKKRGKVLFQGVLSFAIVVLAVLVLFSSNIDGDGNSMPIYGSDSEPYGGMYLEWSELNGGEIFYLAEGSPVEIHCPDHNLNGFWQFLDGTGLVADPGTFTISGELRDTTSITIDGKTISLRMVNAQYGDLPIYGDRDWTHAETYTANIAEPFSGVYQPGLGIITEDNNLIENYNQYVAEKPSWVAAVFGSYTKEFEDEFGQTNTGTYREYQISGTPMELGTYTIIFVEEWDAKTGTLGHVKHTTTLTVEVVKPSTTYLVTFHTGNQGTCNVSSVYIPAGQTYLLPNVVCTDPSTVFKGWYISETAVTPVGYPGEPIPNVSMSLVEDTILYAQYTVPSNRVVSISVDSSISVRVGTTSSLNVTTNLLNGESFDEEKRHIMFSPEDSTYASMTLLHTTTGGTIKITGTSVGSFTLTITSVNDPSITEECEVHVIENATTQSYDYSVFYIMDGGTPSGPNDSFTKDTPTTSFTFFGTTPVKYGYDFAGWSIGSKNGTLYDCGATTTISYGDTYIYANWTECKYLYTVSLYDNTGTEKLGEVTLPSSDERVYLTIDYQPAKPNFEFFGWASSKGSDIVVCNPGGSYPMSSSNTLVSLYAVFTAESETDTFRLTFNDNNGFNGPGFIESDPVAANQYVFTIPSTEPVRTGWYFTGWSDQKGDEPKYRYNGQGGLLSEVTVYTGGKTIFACWEQNNRTLEFNLTGGSGYVPTQIGYEANDYYVDIPDVIPVKTGKVFAGWSFDPYTSPTELDKLYFAKNSVRLEQSCFMYAIWSDNTSGTEYTVTFDIGNDATGAPEPLKEKVTIDDNGIIVIPTFTIPDESPKSEGRVFLGWSLSENATTPTYYKGDKYHPLMQNTILHAVWSGGDNRWKVEFYKTGTDTKPYDTKYAVITSGYWDITLPNPGQIDGYVFVGWSSDKNATPDDKTTPVGGTYRSNGPELKLYGVWKVGEESKGKITFNLNGGKGQVPTDITLVSYGVIEQFIPSEPTPTREGHIFVGWCEDPTGNDEVWAAGSFFKRTVDKDEVITLFAIYLDAGGSETIDFTIEYYDSYKNLIGKDTCPTNTDSAGFVLWGKEKVDVPNGYTFDGWSETPNGKPVDTKDGIYTSNVLNRHLYAIFTAVDPNMPHVDWEITMDGLTVHFDASSCRNVLDYNWTLNDGHVFSGKTFDYTFPSSGKYLVKLACTGTDGKIHEKIETIEVKSYFESVKYVILIVVAFVFIIAALRIKGAF